MPQAVIFDIDGTLVDSVEFHTQAWVKALEKFGHKVEPEQVSQKIGMGSQLIMQDFMSEEEVEKKGEDINSFRERYFNENFVEKVKPFDGVRSLFQKLKENNIPIILATSAEEDLAQHYVDLLEVGGLIEGMTSAGDVDNAKPDPEVFKIATQKLSQPANNSEIIVVGDSPYDAKAAVKIDLKSMGVLSGGFSEEELTSAGCIAVYQDIADMLENYERSPLKS